MRSARMSTGLRGLWDRVSGNRHKRQKQNEKEAWQALQRDQEQRDHLVKEQMRERRKLQQDIDILRRRHIKNRRILARDIAQTMRMSEQIDRMQSRERLKSHDRIPGYRGPKL